MLKPRVPKRLHSLGALNLSLLVILLGLGGGAWMVLIDSDASESASTATTQAQRTDVTSTVSADGTVGATDSADVDFNTDGTISEIPVKVGDEVRIGDVLAYVSNATAGQELAAAKADLRAAKANREAVEEETEDDDDDATSTTTDEVSDEERDKQRLEAKASVEQAELAVLQAQESMDDLVLRAPVDGTITAINGTVGSKTNGVGSDSDSDSGSAFATISDQSSWVVECDFAEADVAKVKEGDKVEITFGAVPGETFTGKVRKIDLTATTSDNVTTYGVEVDVVNAPSELRDGASAGVTVTTASASNVLAVPTSAVTTDAQGDSTVKIVKGRKSTSRTVQIGIKGDIYTEIKSGLSAGDVVELGATSTSTSGNQPDVFVGRGPGPAGAGGAKVVKGAGG